MADVPVRYDLPAGHNANVVQITIGGKTIFIVDSSGNAIFAGKVTTPALMSVPALGAPATSALDTHCATATVVGNDEAGLITIVSDATGISASLPICTVTFANTTLYANTPIVVLTNQTTGVASTSLYAGSFGAKTVSAAGFVVVNGVAATTASSTYVVAYQVIGRG